RCGRRAETTGTPCTRRVAGERGAAQRRCRAVDLEDADGRSARAAAATAPVTAVTSVTAVTRCAAARVGAAEPTRAATLPTTADTSRAPLAAEAAHDVVVGHGRRGGIGDHPDRRTAGVPTAATRDRSRSAGAATATAGAVCIGAGVTTAAA